MDEAERDEGDAKQREVFWLVFVVVVAEGWYVIR
jgi:hypothetical protein